MIDLDNN